MLAFMKEIRINVRTTEAIKRDLEIAAELRGITVSALVNQLARSVIREERERDPRAFDVVIERPNGKVVGQVLPGQKKDPTKGDVRIMYQKESDIVDVGEQRPVRKKKAS